MKKVLFIFCLLLATAAQAQITVTKLDNTPITEGQVFTFTSLEYDYAYMGFLVHNNGTANTNVRIECVSITNGTGAGMELCLGNVCLSAVSPGHAYPSTAVTIAPGGTNSEFDHFLNTNGGDGVNPIEYVFKFYQEDESGDPVGNSVTITYRYAPQLGVGSFATYSNAGVQLKSNRVENQLEISALKNVQMEMYDVNGKTIQRQQLTAGDNTLDVSNLNAGVYILNFKSESNQTSTTKFIKK